MMQATDSPEYEQKLKLGDLMRLVCPNCAAQYEVDESAIPTDGRDVQCANCGNTWFQDKITGPAESAPSEDDPFLETPEDSDDDNDSADGSAFGSAGEAGDDHDGYDDGDLDEDEPDNDDLSDAQDEDDDDDEATDGDKPRRTIRPSAPPTDPTVLEILRREAEHETARREDETPDSDVDSENTAADADEDDEDEQSLAFRARAARSRLTASREETNDRLRGQKTHIIGQDDDEDDNGASADNTQTDDDEADDFSDIAPAPRRNRPAEPPQRELPDVQELNSTLRSARDKNRAQAAAAALPPEIEKPRGGRSGFYLAVLVFLVLLAIYGLESQIKAALPQTGSFLELYVDFVDAARHQLAAAVAGLINVAKNLLAQYL